MIFYSRFGQQKYLGNSQSSPKLLENYRELKKIEHSLYFTTFTSKSIINLILEGNSTRLGDLESSNSLVLTTFLDPRFKNTLSPMRMLEKPARKLL